MKHVFLTGEKQVGKSTAIRNFLAARKWKTGGFLTVRTAGICGDAMTVHILDAAKGEHPSAENMLFSIGTDRAEAAERFNSLGSRTLVLNGDEKLILMDELGPHESEAELFKAAVIRTLDGSIPVLGVLQKAKSDFLEEIASRPDVTVIEVTEENRAGVPGMLEKLFAE